jgi:hypothetical protein
MSITSTDQIPVVSDLAPSAVVEPGVEVGGLHVALARPDASLGVAVSDAWKVGGWMIQFVRLANHRRLGLDQNEGKIHVKVITGTLTQPVRGPFAASRKVRDTLVSNSTIQAGDHGALLAVITETPSVADKINSMDQLVFRGPFAEHLRWSSFEQKFGRSTAVFDGLDAHIVPGFHLLDEDRTEIVYLHFWTAGKGVDCSTHDHSQDPAIVGPAFAEIHWVLQNGTGHGAMYECEAIGARERTSLRLQRGQEHGPFWDADPTTGFPMRRANGAVKYGYHGWQAGSDDSSGQSYDFVAAFEFNPDYAKL